MPVTVAALGGQGPPAKWSEGHFRFLCPGCGELRATVNPRNNLAHCFSCQRNVNNIDLLMTLGHDFRSAVEILTAWLHQYEARTAKLFPLSRRDRSSTPSACRESRHATRVPPVNNALHTTPAIPLQNPQQFGKRPSTAPNSLHAEFGNKCDQNLARHSELRATVNPRNNLAHCFSCQRNVNNIDLLMTLGHDFRSAVEILTAWLHQYEARTAKLPPSTK